MQTNWTDLKFLHIFKKDIKETKNRLSSILFVYGLYFAIIFFSLRSLANFLPKENENFLLVFLFLFVVQTVLIISIMIFPQYIFSESMREKHEVYFAYHYSVLDIVLGKSMALTLLSLFPTYLFLFVFYSSIIPFSFIFWLTILVVLPAFSFVLISLNVFASWFSKVGRFTNVFFIMLIVIFFSKFKTIIQMVTTVPLYFIPSALFAFTLLIFLLLFVLTNVMSKEKAVLKS